MQSVNHPNVVKLVDNFYTSGDKPGSDEVFLNLVLEFIPDTVYRVCRHYSKLKQPLPLLYAKVRLFGGTSTFINFSIFLVIYISIVTITCLYSFCWYLS